MKMRLTILALLVAVTPQTRAAIHRTFKPDDFEVLWASSSSEALETSARQRPDLLLLDLSEPPQAGRQVFDNLRAANPDAPIVLLADTETSSALPGAGQAAAVIHKPFDADTLGAAVKALLKKPAANEASEHRAIMVKAENYRERLRHQATAPFVFSIPYDHSGLNE